MVEVVKMLRQHIKQVVSIEKVSFTTAWSENSFFREIERNKFAIYFVALDSKSKEVLGYGGMWNVASEGHITNIAVAPSHRNKGIASLILQKLIDVSKEYEIGAITLEVRVSNQIAQNLYKKHGFILQGVRKEYYDDNKEDALIMWKYL